METEEEIIMKERYLEIDAAFKRLMRIRKIRRKKRLMLWLKQHKN
jgi:hypothetical protein